MPTGPLLGLPAGVIDGQWRATSLRGMVVELIDSSGIAQVATLFVRVLLGGVGSAHRAVTGVDGLDIVRMLRKLLTVRCWGSPG